MKRPMRKKVVKEWGKGDRCAVAKSIFCDSYKEMNNPRCSLSCPLFCKGGKLIAYEPIPFPEGYVEAKVGEKIDKRWMLWREIDEKFSPVHPSHWLGEEYTGEKLKLYAIRPDYPDPGEGYELIVAEDMPIGEEITPGMYEGFYKKGSPQWVMYRATGIHWDGPATPEYFRRRRTKTPDTAEKVLEELAKVECAHLQPPCIVCMLGGDRLYSGSCLRERAENLLGADK